MLIAFECRYSGNKWSSLHIRQKYEWS